MASFKAKSRRGFTLIEVLVTVAIVAVVALIAAPSMKNFIQMQRLKSVSSELMTNLQFARSEAVARGLVVGVRFQAYPNGSGMTCYTIASRVTNGCVASTLDACDCTRGPGAACDASVALSERWVELKTVVIPNSLGVLAEPRPRWRVNFPVSFDPTSGGLLYTNCNHVGALVRPFEAEVTRASPIAGRLQTVVSPTGRPSMCSCEGNVPGYPTCTGTATCPPLPPSPP